MPVLVGEPVQPWPRVMRSPESRLTPCLPAHSKLVNQSAPRQSALYLAFVDLHFQTMPSTQYSHNIHTIFTQYCTFKIMPSTQYSRHCQLPRMLNLQLPCIAWQFLAVVGSSFSRMMSRQFSKLSTSLPKEEQAEHIPPLPPREELEGKKGGQEEQPSHISSHRSHDETIQEGH